MADAIEISVRDVSDVEGHVFARFVRAGTVESDADDSTPITLRGTLRGPYCETAHTLPAEFKFRDLGPQQPGLAEAIVPDPCTWSPELPHVYQADVEALQGDCVVAEFHGLVGLRRASP